MENGISIMAEALITQGVMTREQLDAGMAAEAADVSADAPPAAADDKALVPEQIGQGETPPDPLGEFELDPAFDRPGKPGDYRFQTAPNNPLDPPEAKEVQAWCHAARLPQPIAQHLFTTIERMGDQPMPNEQVELLTRKTMAQLNYVWGGKTEEMIAHGRRLIDEVSRVHPRLRDLLELSGAGSDPVVVQQICNHAARLFSSKPK